MPPTCEHDLVGKAALGQHQLLLRPRPDKREQGHERCQHRVGTLAAKALEEPPGKGRQALILSSFV